MLETKCTNLLPVRRHKRRRHQIPEQHDEELFWGIADMKWIVGHQRFGMDAFEQMRGRDVGHVERRILPHKDDIRARQVVGAGVTEREVIARNVAHSHGTHARGDRAIAKCEIAGAIIE